jgi:hypothetical protein
MGGSHDEEELAMQTVTTIGLDIAKSVFQVQRLRTLRPRHLAPFQEQGRP